MPNGKPKCQCELRQPQMARRLLGSALPRGAPQGGLLAPGQTGGWLWRKGPSPEAVPRHSAPHQLAWLSDHVPLESSTLRVTPHTDPVGRDTLSEVPQQEPLTRSLPRSPQPTVAHLQRSEARLGSSKCLGTRVARRSRPSQGAQHLRFPRYVCGTGISRSQGLS